MDMKVNWMALNLCGGVELEVGGILEWYDVSFPEMDVVLVNVGGQGVVGTAGEATVFESGDVEHIAPLASWEPEYGLILFLHM